MYGHVNVGQPIRFGAFVAVSSVDDLDYLIKESELVLSRPGREFQASLNDTTLKYRVSRCGPGYEVTAIASEQCQGRPYFVSRGDLAISTLGQAMSHGRLFTAAV